jgi:hypothetical protein
VLMLARFACWWTRLCYLSVEGDQANVPTETCVCGETEDWLADCFVLLQLTVRASVRMSGRWKCRTCRTFPAPECANVGLPVVKPDISKFLQDHEALEIGHAQTQRLCPGRAYRASHASASATFRRSCNITEIGQVSWTNTIVACRKRASPITLALILSVCSCPLSKSFAAFHA